MSQVTWKKFNKIVQASSSVSSSSKMTACWFFTNFLMFFVFYLLKKLSLTKFDKILWGSKNGPYVRLIYKNFFLKFEKKVTLNETKNTRYEELIVYFGVFVGLSKKKLDYSEDFCNPLSVKAKSVSIKKAMTLVSNWFGYMLGINNNIIHLE